MKQKNMGLVLQLLSNNGPSLFNLDTEPQLLKILDQFQDIFREPIGLPLDCDHNHHIELQPGAKPVCVGPYHYPYFKKTEIEKLVQDMLTLGII